MNENEKTIVHNSFTLSMDTDYAPDYSTVELKDGKRTGIKFIVIEDEDGNITMLEDTEANTKMIASMDSDVKIIADGTSNVSLAKLIYGLGSAQRSLYRKGINDINQKLTEFMEDIKERFTDHDRYIKELYDYLYNEKEEENE